MYMNDNLCELLGNLYLVYTGKFIESVFGRMNLSLYPWLHQIFVICYVGSSPQKSFLKLVATCRDRFT